MVIQRRTEDSGVQWDAGDTENRETATPGYRRAKGPMPLQKGPRNPRIAPGLEAGLGILLADVPSTLQPWGRLGPKRQRGIKH